MAAGPVYAKVYYTSQGSIITIPLSLFEAAGVEPRSEYCVRLGHGELTLAPADGCRPVVRAYLDRRGRRLVLRLSSRMLRRLGAPRSVAIFLDDNITVRFGCG